MTVISDEKLGDRIECYIDDLVVKSCQRVDHLKHPTKYSTYYNNSN